MIKKNRLVSLPKLIDRSNTGSFVKTDEQTLTSRTYKKHRVILQTLDRMTNWVYFPAELFEKYIDRWEKIPVLYGLQHPVIEQFIDSPDEELNRVGARVAGYITNAFVDKTGHPRLYADIVLNDAYAESLISEGHLGLSTGFRCADDGYELTGEIYPNHVLIFYEDVNNLPADFGAGFLNKQTAKNNVGGTMPKNNPLEGDTPEKNIPEPKSKDTIPEIVNVKPEDNLPPLSSVNGNKDYLNLREQYIQDTARMQAVNESLVSTNEELKERLHAFEVRERNQKIESVISNIPREMVKRLDPETIRDRLNKNPLSVLESIVGLYNEQISRMSQSTRTAEGNQYLNNAVANRLNTQTGAGGTGSGTDLSTQGLCSRIIVDDEEI